MEQILKNKNSVKIDCDNLVRSISFCLILENHIFIRLIVVSDWVKFAEIALVVCLLMACVLVMKS